MPETVLVSGVPGVGASEVCTQARRELGDRYTLVNFGDVMLEEALEHGLAESRRSLVDLPLRDQRHLQRRAGEYVARAADEGPLLVNTHLVIESPHGFLPGLPAPVRADVDPSVVVVVDAPAEEIQRRRRSSDRSYAEDSDLAVEFHRQLQTAAAYECSASTGAPVQHVSNDEGADTAAAELVDVVETAVR